MNDKEKDKINKDHQYLATLCAALAHPIRITILRKLLAVEGCYVGELSQELPIAQSTISQHLKKLKLSGLIKGTLEGPKTCYCINPETLQIFKNLIQDL